MTIDLNTKSLTEIQSMLFCEIEQVELHRENIRILQEARKRAAEREQKAQPEAPKNVMPMTDA